MNRKREYNMDHAIVKQKGKLCTHSSWILEDALAIALNIIGTTMI